MHKKGSFLITMGLLLLAAALLLTGYNIWDGVRAGKAAQETSAELALLIPNYRQPEPTVSAAEPNEPAAETIPVIAEIPEREMPTALIRGYRYIGILDVDSLGLSLPIMEEWSYDHLRISPCRFTGNVYQNNLVLCAHNYPLHFSSLKTVPIGTPISFTDMDGEEFRYTVSSVEIVDPNALEQMITGDWDLTLFTCTTGGQTRCAIRCDRVQ